MTDYTFTGAHPRILTGLSQGVNAFIHHAADPATPDGTTTAAVTPYGSTIVAHPGDVLQTDEPYEHPELAEVEADKPTPKPPKPSRTTTPATADPTDN